MADQMVFKRYELKYMLTKEQKEKVLEAMEPYMVMDKFGRSTIRNIYFDTDNYILARHSIAKPEFKEKLRIRSYSKVTSDEKVFVELKRKFDQVVYKRRVALPEEAAMAWTTGTVKENDALTESATSSGSISAAGTSFNDHQLSAEISYFLNYYKTLQPVMFLSYDREAYRMRDGMPDNGFRVTFDENIMCRDYDMSLTSDVYGERILEEGKVLMELKCAGGIPLWMIKVLSEEKIYKTSFSKYGTAYSEFIGAKASTVAAARLAAEEAGAMSSETNTSTNTGADRNTGTSRSRNKDRNTIPKEHPVYGILGIFNSKKYQSEHALTA